MSAYDEGREAYWSGQRSWNNPYNGDAARDWENGYFDAADDDNAERYS